MKWSSERLPDRRIKTIQRARLEGGPVWKRVFPEAGEIAPISGLC